jgi:hypothetical protein
MRGVMPPVPHFVFMAWCLVKHRDNFTFTLYCGYCYVRELRVCKTRSWCIVIGRLKCGGGDDDVMRLELTV